MINIFENNCFCTITVKLKRLPSPIRPTIFKWRRSQEPVFQMIWDFKQKSKFSFYLSYKSCLRIDIALKIVNSILVFNTKHFNISICALLLQEPNKKSVIVFIVYTFNCQPTMVKYWLHETQNTHFWFVDACLA